MNIKKINPTSMKQPNKAYSNGILVDLDNAQILFVTGQLAQDDQGNVVAPFDYEEQTKFIFGQLGKILNASEMSFDDVVKAQIFVKDIHNSSKISAIRDEYFKNSKPASTMVEVGGFVKDGCCVEIEIIAVK